MFTSKGALNKKLTRQHNKQHDKLNTNSLQHHLTEFVAMSSSILYDDPDFEAEMEHLMALPLVQKEAALSHMAVLFNIIVNNLTSTKHLRTNLFL